MEDFMLEDTFKDFIRQAKKFPLLSKSETLRLFEEYKNGDQNAFDKLVNSNLRLVVSVAHSYNKNLNHMQMMDIIQEGIIGLMNAIKKYNPEQGALSTYATWWIKQAISRSIMYEDSEIKKTPNFHEAKTKYDKYIKKCLDLGEEIPQDEELCDILDITKETLNNIRNASNFNPVSLNDVVKDGEDTELGSFMGIDDSSYDNFSEDFDTKRLMVVLKEILRPVDYYVIYYRYLTDNRKTLDDIGSVFNISRERVRQIENRALRKAKPYMEQNNTYFADVINKLRKTINLNKYKTDPVKPQDIAKFLYLKSSLTDLEVRLLYLRAFGKIEYSKSELCRELFCSLEELEELEMSLKDKMHQKFKNAKKLKSFISQTLKNYGTKIYEIKLEDSHIDYDKIKGLLNLSSNEFFSMYSDELQYLTISELNLLKRYFGVPESCAKSNYLIEKDVYLTVFGYKNMKPPVSKTKIYQKFLEKLDEFDEEQILYLECYFFNKKDKSEFNQKYPNSICHSHRNNLYLKLLMVYYNISGLLQNNFNKERYLRVKENYSKKLTDRRILLLDLFYGVNGKALSIKEIAELLQEDYVKIHDEIKNARDYVINLDTNNHYSLNINYEEYKPYILDEKYVLTDETRWILKLFIIDESNYDVISEKTGLGKYRISNIITDGLRKIDYYRFGIIKPISFTSSEFESFITESASDMDEIDKKILYDKIVILMSNEEIMRKHNVSIVKINHVMKKFNKYFMSWKTSGINISVEDIEEEINKHPIDSVLNEEEKSILSLYYGIKNSYNIDGNKHTKVRISELLRMQQTTIAKRIKESILKIKSRKVGILKPEYIYIARGDLEQIFKDPHLPLSDEKKELVCYLFEINNYPYKSPEELAEMLQITLPSLKRSYERAIITIYKYLNHEIEGKINYEEEIKPNLRFFSKSDELFIRESFENKLTNLEISEKYNLSLDYVNRHIQRLKVTIYEIVMDPFSRRFDFAYYREVINNPDLPYYGDIDLAKTIFDLFFGESILGGMSIPKIIEYLNIQFVESTINKLIFSLMISIYNYRAGERKEKLITYDNVISYYERHKDEMSSTKKSKYESCLKNRFKNRIIFLTPLANSSIIFDLLKEHYSNYFNLNDANREDVIQMLKKYHKELDYETCCSLMCLFDIREKEFMSGRDINHVFKILGRLEQYKLDLNNGSILKRNNNDSNFAN